MGSMSALAVCMVTQTSTCNLLTRVEELWNRSVAGHQLARQAFRAVYSEVLCVNTTCDMRYVACLQGADEQASRAGSRQPQLGFAWRSSQPGMKDLVKQEGVVCAASWLVQLSHLLHVPACCWQ
jgi:hypothetical protein